MHRPSPDDVASANIHRMASNLLTTLAAGFDRHVVRRIVTTLLIGLAGGAVFAFFDLPLPWMLGAMAASMAASLGGADLAMPQSFRKPMMAIVGVTLGSAFTPDRLQGMTDWLPSLLTLPFYVALIGIMILFYLRRVSGFDAQTAFFAATPGGLSEMVLLADQQGGDMRNVALFHSARLVLIVFSIPLIANFLVTVQPVTIIDPAKDFLALDLVLLALLLAAGWALAIPLRLPSPPFMGPLFLSSAVHLLGITDVGTPFAIVAAAQLVIGSSVGSRFSGVPLRLILQTLTVGAGGALMMFAVTLVFGVALHWATGYPLALLLLALIPGGFPEMSLIALGMGFDPAFVVTHHGVRVLLVVAFALPIHMWLLRSGWFGRHWPQASTTTPVIDGETPQSERAETDPETGPKTG